MPRKYHHGNLRAAIVAIARDQLRLSTQADLSLRALARIAGVSPNAPYRHFKGKDGLTVALAAEGYRELALLGERALATEKPIEALATGYQELVTREAALLRVVNAESFRGRDPESEVMLARDEWFAMVVAIVEKVAGSLHSSERYRRAAGVWAILLGVHELRHHGGRGLLTAELLPDAADLALRVARGR